MPEKVRISYAQNGEDVRVWRAFRDLQDGFYVEVGASDPWEDSTTAALSALGWSGLLVEADVELAARLREARPRDVVVQAAAHSRGGLLDFDPGSARGLGSVVGPGGGTARVPAVRVGDLLADLDPPSVHFMSVDVEGGESDALAGADLQRWQPWVLSVEATAPNSRTPTHEAWEGLVLEAGYTLAGTDGLNRWYVAAGHEDLAPLVAEPLNALDENLDGWFRSKEVALRERAERVQAELDTAVAGYEDELTRLRSEHDRAITELRSDHAAALRRLKDEHGRALGQVQEELGSVRAELAAALAREQVLLTSKSWRITKPMRDARLSAWLLLQQRCEHRHETEPPHPQRAADETGDARRRAALRARIEAARGRSRR